MVGHLTHVSGVKERSLVKLMCLTFRTLWSTVVVVVVIPVTTPCFFGPRLNEDEDEKVNEVKIGISTVCLIYYSCLLSYHRQVLTHQQLCLDCSL